MVINIHWKYRVIPLIVLLLLSNCKNDDNSGLNDFRQFVGDYKIISYHSNISVDLNNDKESSAELIYEITSFGNTDLEIGPKEYQSTSAKLVSFFLPKTWITFQYPEHPEGVVEFLDYGFGTSYEFKNNSFLLNQNQYVEESFIDNESSNKTVYLKSDLIVLDKNHLKLSISKEYYDFNRLDWVLLDIEILYERRH